MAAIAAGGASCRSAQRTSSGEAAAGHAGGTEGTSNGNHGDGVCRGDKMGMNWMG
jgi:hypothetical protein